MAGAEHRRAALYVLAGEATILACLRNRAGRNAHAVRRDACALLHHDRVGAWRHHAAGEDAHRFAVTERTGEWLSRERFADAPQRRPGGIQIGEADGPAVHRGIVVSGHVDRRLDVRREHASERGADMHALDRGDRLEELPDQRACALDRQRVRIVVVGAGQLTQRAGGFHRRPGWHSRRARPRY